MKTFSFGGFAYRHRSILTSIDVAHLSPFALGYGAVQSCDVCIAHGI
jgi:hypothetical protein